MAEKEIFDVVVIGGGPGGYVAAIRASQLGLKAACIEFRGTLGGTCLNVGCIPSKALLESSEMYEKISKHASEYGVKVSKVVADIGAMIERKNGIVSKFTKGIEGLFKKNKVAYFKGKGSFLGPNEVSVKDVKGGETILGAKHVIIATGSEAVQIPVAKFDGKVVVSSTEALDFKDVPDHLIVIGGGVIGLEMGSVWRRLGAKVTVIEALPAILFNMDEAISKGMTKIMEKQGMGLQVNTKVTEVKVSGSKAVVKADCDGKIKEFTGDKVLVCVGRRAFIDGLGLDKVGVQAKPNGKIIVDEHLQTSVPNIYAIGDVIDGLMLAHKAEEEGVAVAERIAGKPGHVNYKAIPNIIYTWPEVASVGLSEKECKDHGIEYNTGQFPFVANGRAACLGTTDGFVKIIADKNTDQMLGVHIIGPNASELISEVVIAFEFSASAEDLARSVHAHPTLAEVIKEAALAVDKRALHI